MAQQQRDAIETSLVGATVTSWRAMKSRASFGGVIAGIGVLRGRIENAASAYQRPSAPPGWVATAAKTDTVRAHALALRQARDGGGGAELSSPASLGVTVLIAIYVLLQLALGAWIGRRMRTEEDYLLAGRRLGYSLATFTIFATWFGAETCIGAAGSIYQGGLSAGTTEPFGYGACLLLCGLLFAVGLWRQGLTTLADFYRNRYSPAIERFTVLLLVPTSVFWAAAQIRAFGQVVSASTGLGPTLTITIAASVVIVYTMSGGMLADVWTDLVQGIALIVGLGVLLVAVMWQSGSAPFRAAAADLTLSPPDGGLLGFLEAWSIPVVGSVIATEVVSRILATRSPQVARRSTLLAGGIYIAIGLIPVTLGLAAQSLLPGLDQPEQVLPALAQRYLPGLFYALFAGAIISAILSTVDSTLLVAASLTSHNLLLRLGKREWRERDKVLLARSCVVAFGVVSYLLALSAEGVYALIEQSSAFGSAGIVVVYVIGSTSTLGGPASAGAALLAGSLTWTLGSNFGLLPYPYLTALAMSVLAYVVVLPVERERTAAAVL